MLDVKRIRNDFDALSEKLATRGVVAETLNELKELDVKRRELLIKSEELKAQRNIASDDIAQAKRNKEDASEQIAAMQKVSAEIKEIDAELAAIDEKLNTIIVTLPNIPNDSVPVGADEDENVEVRRWGTPRDFDFEVKAHWDLGEDLGILDWERGAKVTGSRFLFYKGLGARLERAIYNFMLDEHAKEGYTEMITPYMVNHDSMFGTGQYPKFKEDTFELDGTDYVLIPTAEVPLTNYYRGEILDGKELPIYFTALSPSFRSEAGSAGRDTRGLIRLHQFHKVEMVKFSKPEDSYDELEKMVVNAENILQKLNLPYRVITLCTGQYPKFKEDTFELDGTDYVLIPTAEVPLTNYYRGEILDGKELPIYFTALSPSFRSEAGSAGRDTRGLIRLHQFHKVEMVKFSKPEDSYDELEKMVVNAENILQKLNLPYRVITLCTGDMGFSAAKTYDLEVWIPAQNTYREISSCSNTEDFQARRAQIRYRDEADGKVKLLHTLNGSGLAVGRTVAAILENYQNEDGSVTIPEVLRPYMGGAEVILPK